MQNTPHISIVSPVYGCKTCLVELYLRLKTTLETINPDFEIIFVNDASPDGAWQTISELAQKDTRVKGLNLSRNFGQHYAITAGLDHAQGNWVVVMDCDLQDQPEEIIKLYNKALEGYDVVVGRRVQRKDTFFKQLTSQLFAKLFDYLTDQKTNPEVANFGIYSKQFIANVTSFREEFRNFGLMRNWLGFNRFELEINHAERPHGETSYNFSKRLHLATESIVSYSDKPLRLFFKLGLTMSILSVVFATFIVCRYFFLKTPFPGWTSIIVSLFFLSGLLLACMGFIGLYIGKIFKQVKDRPLYVIQNKLNCNVE